MNNEIGKSFLSVTASLAAIIPDTPIVSIAGSTLSEITTTTTSTTTTPTPTATSLEPSKVDISLPNHNPMSDAAAKSAGATSSAAAVNVTTNINLNKEPTPAAAHKSEKIVDTDLKETDTWVDSLDDIKLKNLLEEAYSYRNPIDKENKSEIFLQLLEKAESEKEDQTFSFSAIASRFTRNSSSSTTSNSHKQGGSLQDLVESTSDCDYSAGGQRHRRSNHYSRQKKFSSVSSRQREGGSLPSNVNVANSGGLLGTLEQPAFMKELRASASLKQQRRNTKTNTAKETEKDNVAGTTATGTTKNSNDSVGSSGTNIINKLNPNDTIININEPIEDIQQQQQVLLSDGNEITQGNHIYERWGVDVRIPRANIVTTVQTKVDSSRNFVDDQIRFEHLDRGEKYFPLDENYKACRSVMGEKSDTLKSSNTMFASKLSTVSRQYDENGNSLSEILQSSSGASNIFSSGNNSQSLAKAKKKKTQQDRNTKIVDLESVDGYRGKDPIHVLVKYIENPSDSKGVKGNENPKKKDRNKKESRDKERDSKEKDNKEKYIKDRESKDKEVKEKENKENDVKEKDKDIKEKDCKENDIKEKEKDKDIKEKDMKFKDMKEKEFKDSTDIKDIKEFKDTKEKDNKDSKEYKDSREHRNKTSKISTSCEELANCSDEENNVLKRSGVNTENAVTMRGKTTNKNKNHSLSSADINKNVDGSSKINPSASRKNERRSWGTEELQYLGENSKVNEEKLKERKNNKYKDREIEKDGKLLDKPEKNVNSIDELLNSKTEKRKKFENLVHSNAESTYGDVNFLEMDAIVPETAEFHVVTKKKKTKKQRANMDETNVNCGGVANFNRTHNITNTQQQKLTSGVQQQQLRYKNNSSFIAGNLDRIEYTNNNHPNSHSNHQSYISNQQLNSDKSRRKSTSSMPPSEKSDSSDHDSVHSLPIESAIKNKQRHKNSNVPTSSSTAGKGYANSSPAPISYADITRTNKEIISANANSVDKWPTVDVSNNNINDVTGITDETQTSSNQQSSTILGSKIKAKKVSSKSDFPELLPILNPEHNGIKSVITKPISYSQSLTTVPSGYNTSNSIVTSSDMSITTALTNTFENNIDIKDPKSEKSNTFMENDKTSIVAATSGVTRNQAGMQQPLQKSKSVEHDNYNSNLDQQYPALEKTVKRHSATNVSVVANSMSTPLSAPGQFNFAAAAKQQINTNFEGIQKQSTPLTTSSNVVTMNTQIATPANTTANAGIKKSKEKLSPSITSQIIDSTTNDSFINNNVIQMKKMKKEQKHESNDSNVAQKLSAATQTQTQPVPKICTTSANEVVTAKQLNNTSNAQKINSMLNTTQNKTNATQTISNRPAVIILNDDSGFVLSNNQFTFGDFNEEELRFLDNEMTQKVIHGKDNFEKSDIMENVSNRNVHVSISTNLTKSSTPAAIFNDSGTSSDIINNSIQHGDDIMLIPSVDASSPNTSFINNQVVNQSNDSGLNDSNKSKSSSNNKRTPISKIANTKMNSFTNNPATALTNKASEDGKPSSYNANNICPPQQLETCNDIETAILAAARAAADQNQNQHQQQCQHHQGVHYETFNSSSNCSSLSSSVSVDAKYTPQSPTFVANNFSNINCQTQQFESDYLIRSRSNSSGQRDYPSSHVVSIQEQEFDLQYIPPTNSDAFNKQHNDFIVAYIDSAWEEIANSKLTVYYDGQ
ncbi:probable WRKY transcription factor protein 1 [Teleopsis dalmanni]|uniref:probable WRKY transcription factor protein 1 n=1 Tax=Teleopsis dalmanni TaxID=139649 RepID=UPI0018CF5B04|nr:probable WRKY transcription factor protein 1 [Teleopsis dalmanni]